MQFIMVQSWKKVRNGFTLLEILLVVAAIAILAGIVILAINPTKQLGDTRNAQRRVDVNTILNAVYQYAIDNTGTVPANIPATGSCALLSTANEICVSTIGANCTGKVDLAVLTDDAKYLVSMPTDPSGAAGSGTGYYIVKDGNARVSVCAPYAEQSATISVTR